jgi:hypothetical protein
VDVRQYLGRLGAECNSSSHLYVCPLGLPQFGGYQSVESLRKCPCLLVPPPHPKRAFGGASSLRVVSSDFAISRPRPKPQLLTRHLSRGKNCETQNSQKIDRVGVDARSTVPLHTPLASRPSPASPAGVIPALGTSPVPSTNVQKSNQKPLPKTLQLEARVALGFSTTGRRVNSEQKVTRHLVSVRTRGV